MVLTKGEMSKFPVVFNHTYIIPQIPSDTPNLQLCPAPYDTRKLVLCGPDSWLTLVHSRSRNDMASARLTPQRPTNVTLLSKTFTMLEVFLQLPS